MRDSCSMHTAEQQYKAYPHVLPPFSAMAQINISITTRCSKRTHPIEPRQGKQKRALPAKSIYVR